VAREPGHLTRTYDVDVLPGAPREIAVALAPLSALDREERRWPAWRPWAVVGGGAALVALGAGLAVSARSELNAFEDEIQRSCRAGCARDDLPEAVWAQRDRAELRDRVGVGALVVGGAVVVGGGVLVVLNQPRQVRVDEDGRRIGAFVSPATSGQRGAMAGVRIRF
jgi:hypothetical protein